MHHCLVHQNRASCANSRLVTEIYADVSVRSDYGFSYSANPAMNHYNALTVYFCSLNRAVNLYVPLRNHMEPVTHCPVNLDCTGEVYAADSEIYIPVNIQLRKYYKPAFVVLELTFSSSHQQKRIHIVALEAVTKRKLYISDGLILHDSSGNVCSILACLQRMLYGYFLAGVYCNDRASAPEIYLLVIANLKRSVGILEQLDICILPLNRRDSCGDNYGLIGELTGKQRLYSCGVYADFHVIGGQRTQHCINRRPSLREKRRVNFHCGGHLVGRNLHENLVVLLKRWVTHTDLAGLFVRDELAYSLEVIADYPVLLEAGIHITFLEVSAQAGEIYSVRFCLQ